MLCRRRTVPLGATRGLLPPPTCGKGHKAMVTGMPHPDTSKIEPEDVKVHQELVKRLSEKVLRNRKDINKWEIMCPGSKTMIVSYRSAALRGKEVAATDSRGGLMRPKSITPLP